MTSRTSKTKIEIVAIPPPPNLPTKVLAEYRSVLEEMVEPLRQQGLKHWAEATRIANEVPIAQVWRQMAQRRLEGELPDC